jgi:hypothetical protein
MEDRRRVKDYKQKLNEMNQRVKQRPLLFEQVAQVSLNCSIDFICRFHAALKSSMLRGTSLVGVKMALSIYFRPNH